ncbi:MAG: hypothetical protein CM1200mP29_10290 [Verrucomicrobiota bacterium]|nr:MAG: hypothetical protein CM1200mP29_10290 [Verrucomicrobiota bacterium]
MVGCMDCLWDRPVTGKPKWKRFAAGMYEPFGLQVLEAKCMSPEGSPYRLHDFNNDGEADFYESFSADTDVPHFSMRLILPCNGTGMAISIT